MSISIIDLFLRMEDDIFNEFASEDGSTELGQHVVIHSTGNDRDSSSSSLFNPCHGGLRNMHMDRIGNELHRLKYRKIKRTIKGIVFENAALCDEVSQLQEKILIAKEERRFLLRKLLNFQGQKDGNMQSNSFASVIGTGILSGVRTGTPENLECKNKKKNPVKKKTQKLTEDSLKAKSKKKKTTGDKITVQPIPLDSSGRPVFPINLGGLTIHSLGEIIPDRPGFHNEEFIFPAGFCSSRMYLSIKDPANQCLYTCTIVDGSYGPRFEIVPDDDPDHPLVGASANECHSNLLKAVNNVCGKEMVKTEGQGGKFFGLSHPIVQNLIQSCPGARKCTDYRWVRFEVSKSGECEGEDQSVQDCDPAISYEVLLQLVSENPET